MVHQRNEQDWRQRRAESIILRWSFRDKKMDETVYTPHTAPTIYSKLKEEFSDEDKGVYVHLYNRLELGEVLVEGYRARGSFQK